MQAALCPVCRNPIPHQLIIHANAVIQGAKGGKAGKGRRDLQQLRAAGRLGGLAKARNAKKRATQKKLLP